MSRQSVSFLCALFFLLSTVSCSGAPAKSAPPDSIASETTVTIAKESSVPSGEAPGHIYTVLGTDTNAITIDADISYPEAALYEGSVIPYVIDAARIEACLCPDQQLEYNSSFGTWVSPDGSYTFSGETWCFNYENHTLDTFFNSVENQWISYESFSEEDRNQLQETLSIVEKTAFDLGLSGTLLKQDLLKPADENGHRFFFIYRANTFNGYRIWDPEYHKFAQDVFTASPYGISQIQGGKHFTVPQDHPVSPISFEEALHDLEMLLDNGEIDGNLNPHPFIRAEIIYFIIPQNEFDYRCRPAWCFCYYHEAANEPYPGICIDAVTGELLKSN